MTQLKQNDVVEINIIINDYIKQGWYTNFNIQRDLNIITGYYVSHYDSQYKLCEYLYTTASDIKSNIGIILNYNPYSCQYEQNKKKYIESYIVLVGDMKYIIPEERLSKLS